MKEILNTENLDLNNLIKGDAECANILKVSPDQVRNLRIAGEIPYTKIGGRYYYNKIKLAQLLLNGKVNYEKCKHDQNK